MDGIYSLPRRTAERNPIIRSRVTHLPAGCAARRDVLPSDSAKSPGNEVWTASCFAHCIGLIWTLTFQPQLCLQLAVRTACSDRGNFLWPGMAGRTASVRVGYYAHGCGCGVDALVQVKAVAI